MKRKSLRVALLVVAVCALSLFILTLASPYIPISRTYASEPVSAVAGGVVVFWLFVRLLLAPRDWSIARTFRLATPARYAAMVLLRAPMFLVSLVLHYYAAHAFGFRIPFGAMLTFQHPMLVPTLTVRENVVIGATRLYKSGFFQCALRTRSSRLEEIARVSAADDTLARRLPVPQADK